MNPSTNAPIYYGPSNLGSDGALLAGIATRSYDYAGMSAADSCSDIRAEVGELRGVVKDAASNIRADIGDVKDVVRDEGQQGVSATKDGVSTLKDALAMNRNATDAQFLALNNRLCESEKEAIKMGYEGRLETIREGDKTREKISHLSERMGDKFEKLTGVVNHGFEEINEKLCECCSEAAVTAATQNGLLNLLVANIK